MARDPQNHHFIVPEAADRNRLARTAKGRLGKALNDAMFAIERANAHRQNNFDGILTGKIDFIQPAGRTAPGQAGQPHQSLRQQSFRPRSCFRRFFRQRHDYLIRNFASKAGKSSGEFFTPAEVGFLMLHRQESNVATYNISRINMILHGIPVWDHKQGDSLHDPRHLTSANRLKQFDRIIKLFQYDYFRAHKQMRL